MLAFGVYERSKSHSYMRRQWTDILTRAELMDVKGADDISSLRQEVGRILVNSAAPNPGQFKRAEKKADQAIGISDTAESKSDKSPVTTIADGRQGRVSS